jgi:hypothetical protein
MPVVRYPNGEGDLYVMELVNRWLDKEFRWDLPRAVESVHKTSDSNSSIFKSMTPTPS